MMVEAFPEGVELVVDDGGERLEEEEELISDNEWDTNRNVKTYDLFRYEANKWISVNLEDNLLNDITNYPFNLREDVWGSIFGFLQTQEDKMPEFIEPPVEASMEAPVEPANFRKDKHFFKWAREIAKVWGISSLAESKELKMVNANLLLPRFLWYRRELVNLYGQESTHEVITSKSSARVIAPSEELIRPAEEGTTTAELQPDSQHGSVESLQDGGGGRGTPTTSDEPDAAAILSPLLIKRKKKKPIVVHTMPLNNEASKTYKGTGNSVQQMERSDALSMAIRDLQFRLSRHATLADPRSYFGKGETSYDKNDPFLDDDELLDEIGLTRDYLDESSSNSSEGDDRLTGSEVEEDRQILSDSSDGNEYMDELYAECEVQFVLDNISEPEEEFSDEDDTQNPADATVVPNPGDAGGPRKKGSGETRELLHCNFMKPTNLPLVYNPRGWRSPKLKEVLPSIGLLFMTTLEYILSAKRVGLLQKKIFDTYELCAVNAEKETVSINEKGEGFLKNFLREVVKAAYKTFLFPFSPQEGIEGLEDVILPRYSKFILQKLDHELSSAKEAFTYGFVDTTDNAETSSIIYHILKHFVSPHCPAYEDCKSWYWAAITQHTVRVFCEKEDQTECLLEEFFVKHNQIDWNEFSTKVQAWTGCKSSEPEGSHEEVDGEEGAFEIFDDLQKTLVNYVIAFNLRRNIYRDLIDVGLWRLVGKIYTRPTGFPEEDPISSIQGVEKLLSVSWLVYMVAMLEEISLRVTDKKFVPTQLWLDSRLRMYRKSLRIPILFERRLRKSSSTYQFDPQGNLLSGNIGNAGDLDKGPFLSKSTPAMGISATSGGGIKRKRESGPMSVSDIHASTLGTQQGHDSQVVGGVCKKKRITASNASAISSKSAPSNSTNSPLPSSVVNRNAIADLLRVYSLSNIVLLLQHLSPVRFPLKISCKMQVIPDTKNTSVNRTIGSSSLPVAVQMSPETKEKKFVQYEMQLTKLRSIDQQQVVYSSGEFNSLNEVLDHIQSNCRSKPMINSIIKSSNIPHDNKSKWFPFRIFSVNLEPCMASTTKDSATKSDNLPVSFNIYDLLVINYWIQSLGTAFLEEPDEKFMRLGPNNNLTPPSTPNLNSICSNSVLLVREGRQEVRKIVMQLPQNLCINVRKNRFELNRKGTDGESPYYERFGTNQIYLLSRWNIHMLTIADFLQNTLEQLSPQIISNLPESSTRFEPTACEISRRRFH